MAALTINQARRILGKDAHGVSDAELEHDIQVATLFHDLFFGFFLRTESGLKIPKVT